jgi:uncharacterized protein
LIEELTAMGTETLILALAAVLVVAFLYSSVGHAGASGYIAVMAITGFQPELIKPAALTLNIFVASVTAWQFRRAGHFSWSLFWPLAAASVPLAFTGGYIHLPVHIFRIIIGIVLLYSAARFLLRTLPDAETHPPSKPVAAAVGGVLGFFSGLTGVGGGIFLTPILLFMRWARTKTASGVSAMFILVNSVAGLSGSYASMGNIPLVTIPFIATALTGGIIGSYFGSRRFSTALIKRMLAIVLIIAGIKLIAG